jgi:hypothetical protein
MGRTKHNYDFGGPFVIGKLKATTYSVYCASSKLAFVHLAPRFTCNDYMCTVIRNKSVGGSA